MSYVEHIRDAVVTDLVYRHLSSWHAVGCYFAWREHHAREELKRLPIGKRVGQGHTRRRLTEHGWLIDAGPLNARVIDERPPVLALVEQQDQARIDAEVDLAREEHEAALLAEDLWLFGRQWCAVVEGEGMAWMAVLRSSGRSEEREAFMARWHAATAAH
jgi:hypothetical protein